VTERRFKRFVEQMTSRIRRLYKKLRGIETTLDPLVDHVGHAEEELHELEERVDRLEKRRRG
jgi:predicted  nucleic acid-binding Zn-ribbon protein